MSDPLVQGGIGIALEHATPSSDGFCVVREITRGGPVDISGYERSNGEVRRVQVGDWLLRVNDISCQDMPRDQIKRYVVGPVGTKVVVVFASRRDNKGITVQLERFRAPLQPNVAGPRKQFNQIEMHARHHDDSGGFSNSQRGRDGPGSQSDRGKGGRDEDRGPERGRYIDSDRLVETETDNERTRDRELGRDRERDTDRERGCDRDKQYTLTQRPSKQFNIEINKQVMRIMGHCHA